MKKFICPKCGEVTDVIKHYIPLADDLIKGLEDGDIKYGFRKEQRNEFVFICWVCRRKIKDINCDLDLKEHLEKHGIEVEKSEIRLDNPISH